MVQHESGVSADHGNATSCWCSRSAAAHFSSHSPKYLNEPLRPRHRSPPNYTTYSQDYLLNRIARNELKVNQRFPTIAARVTVIP
jgi:hypothetical protein